MTSSVLRIASRFRGPPHSGNGGYVAGLLANELGGADCIVTLKAPPPLDETLGLEVDAAGAALWFGDEQVATAGWAPVGVEVPAPPSLDAAEAAARRFTGFRTHIFPGCFVCGPERAPGDGLRIFAGPLEDDSGRVAAVWTPDASLADGDGLVRDEFIWAALDCPGYFAVQERAGLAVLGRLGVVRRAPVAAGEPVIVSGWPIASEGRKHTVGTALHAADGTLLAAGLGTWVSLKPQLAA